jgi:zona occludens toxin
VSIVAYVGLPRSGKSYTAVEQVILPALRQGRIVVTNLPLRLDAIRRDIADAKIVEFSVQAVLATPELIIEGCPSGAVVVLDEVWRLWPAGKKVDKIPEAFKSFLAEHGHRVDAAGNATQIVLITQDLAQIAAFARQLVEQTFRTTKLGVVGLQKRFRTDVYQGGVSGPNPPVSQVTRQIFGRYEPRIYQYYVSHTQSESGQGGADERAIDRRGNVLTRPIMIAAPFVIAGLIWFGVSHLHHSGTLMAEKAAASGRAGGAADAPPSSGFVTAGGRGRHGWWVSSVVKGLSVYGDFATVTDGDRTQWVELKACRVSKFDVACPAEGQFWSNHGYSRPAAQAPVGSPNHSAASGESPGMKPQAGG